MGTMKGWETRRKKAAQSHRYATAVAIVYDSICCCACHCPEHKSSRIRSEIRFEGDPPETKGWTCKDFPLDRERGNGPMKAQAVRSRAKVLAAIIGVMLFLAGIRKRVIATLAVPAAFFLVFLIFVFLRRLFLFIVVLDFAAAVTLRVLEQVAQRATQQALVAGQGAARPLTSPCQPRPALPRWPTGRPWRPRAARWSRPGGGRGRRRSAGRCATKISANSRAARSCTSASMRL